MARPPAGPIGNSPRDVRDDSVGVPADNVDAPEPMRWPPKPKKITKNDFHAKVGGGTSSKRADRAPHFRKGGWVSGYASGGSVQTKREDLPSEKKNDPFAKQNLRKGGNVKKKLADGGDVPLPKPDPRNPRMERTGTYGDRPVKGLPPLPRQPPEHKSGGGVKKKLADGGSFDTGVQQPGKLRSESTELAKARRGFEKAPKDTDAALKMIRTEDETGAYLPRRSTGEGRYKDGGNLSAAQRQSLPKSDFALPGAGKGPKGAGSGSYPIPDESHARNALARSSGKPVAAAVRAKVKAKYPGIGQK